MKTILRQHITERLGRESAHLDQVLTHFTEVKTRRGDHLLLTSDIAKDIARDTRITG